MSGSGPTTSNVPTSRSGTCRRNERFRLAAATPGPAATAKPREGGGDDDSAGEHEGDGQLRVRQLQGGGVVGGPGRRGRLRSRARGAPPSRRPDRDPRAPSSRREGHAGVSASPSRPALDAEGRIRLDDWELEPQLQDEISRRWAGVSTDTLDQMGDFNGFQRRFRQLFGFEIPGINYDSAVDVDLPWPFPA